MDIFIKVTVLFNVLMDFSLTIIHVKYAIQPVYYVKVVRINALYVPKIYFSWQNCLPTIALQINHPKLNILAKWSVP
jgi:hypothetical protein